MITAPLTDDEQTRAEMVFAVLGGLEQGVVPTNWIEQLKIADIGSYGDRWEFSRRLGAHGCMIYWHGKAVTVIGTPSNLEKREGLKTLPPKHKKFRLPFNKPNVLKSDPFIVDCLETSAKVAYVHGFEKAMRICVAAMSEQVI